MSTYVIEILVAPNDSPADHVVDRVRATNKRASNAQLANVLAHENPERVRRRRIRSWADEPDHDLF